MNREDVEKLLGGYATGTLTPEEQQALFEAALDDQQLYDALVREQPLHDLLRDRTARAHLLAALDDPTPNRWALWVRNWRPAVAVACAVCVVAVAGYMAWQANHTPKIATMAELRMPPAPMPSRALPEVRSPEPTPSRAVPEVRGPEPELGRDKAVLPAPAKKTVKAPPERQSVASVADAAAPPPAAAAPAPSNQQARGALGGYGATAGGVIGGIVAGAPPKAFPQFAAPVRKDGARSLYYLPLLAQHFAGGAGGGDRPAQETIDARQRALAQALGQTLVTKAAAPPAMAHLGLKYSVQRQAPDGAFTEAAPDQLRAGETLRLRFVPNDNGYLYVAERTASGLRPVASIHVERDKPFETAAWTPAASGQQEFVVLFSRRPLATRARPELIQAADQKSEADARERATYVVDERGDPASQHVVFTVTLSYQ